jgi:polar amino acid transport system substrate-binding protein
MPNAPGAMPAGSTMREIQQRGRLIAGVSADTLTLAARNPINGRIEGFDIDMIRAVSQAIFGSPDKVELRVITAAQRLPALQDGSVDIVARNMTITCAGGRTSPSPPSTTVPARRSSSGSGSAPTAEVRSPASATSSARRSVLRTGRRAWTSCAPSRGSTAVGSDTHTGCLVLFQQGKVDAITGDDTVLAGLVAQDPYAEVPASDPITAEPYGLGFNKDDKALVQYANTVLAQMRADGRWTKLYDRWLAPSLGPAPAPPTPIYGRA